MFFGEEYNYFVDIWALGVVLFYCVAGYFPFESYVLEKLTRKIMFEEPIYPLNISDDCIDLLTKMLDKEPASRISWEGIFQHPWVKSGLHEFRKEENKNYTKLSRNSSRNASPARIKTDIPKIPRKSSVHHHNENSFSPNRNHDVIRNKSNHLTNSNMDLRLHPHHHHSLHKSPSTNFRHRINGSHGSFDILKNNSSIRKSHLCDSLPQEKYKH